MTDVYSVMKALWHRDKIDMLKQRSYVVPTHVQLIISDLCNQNCHFCAYRMDGGFSSEHFAKDGNKNPNRKIPTSKCYEILNDCADVGVKAIQFTGGGEPTVHPDFDSIIAHAQKLDLETALVTNGTRLPSTAVLEKLTWLRVSLDAGTSATYKKIRESHLWDKVLLNLKLLGNIKGPVIGVGFVITQENYDEIGEACKLVKDCGIPYIRLSAMFSDKGSGYYKYHRKGILELIKVAKDFYEDETFKIIDLFSRRIDDLDQGKPEYITCGYQRFTTYIGGNLKVYRCCTTAYTDHGEIGNLSNMSFRVWLRDHSKGKYNNFDARTCHHCQFNKQNEAINYLLDNNPTHVNFV